MLGEITAWLAGLATAAFGAIWSLIQDAAVAIFTGILSAVGALLSAIPLPDFLTGGLSALWSAMPSGMLYLASAAGVPQALALLGTAFLFRFTRKVFTLFQW